MNVQVNILDGPLPPEAPAAAPRDIGAVVVFEGRVRGVEGDRAIEALDYQLYEPMASMTLRRIAEKVVRRHGVAEMRIEHSRGRVGVGGCSFRLVVFAARRKEALAAVDQFIDRMKLDAPIWKTPIWADEQSAPSPAPSPDPA